jgi:hypothetical protein
LVRILRRHGVPIVVIGSVATCYYAPTRNPPADLDVVVDNSHDSASRAVCAIHEVIQQFPMRHPVREFSAVGIADGLDVLVETQSGRLHIVGDAAGIDRDALLRRRRDVVLDRTRVPLCHISDLIALKARDCRSPDLQDLDLLLQAMQRAPHG